jgi:transcriptional regulator with XRE-family HTH domain
MTELDWHLQEWMALLGKRQAHLIRDLGWSRRKASEVYNGDQQYKRDLVNELAQWLGIRPFELLMPPEEAQRIRQFRDAAYAIAAEKPRAFVSNDDPAAGPEAA